MSARPWEVTAWSTGGQGKRRTHLGVVGRYGTPERAREAAVRDLTLTQSQSTTLASGAFSRVRNVDDTTVPAEWYGWPDDADPRTDPPSLLPAV